jgi:formate hydrogenlyase subunit 3/multisubunit Na+/H+ antiporter MnhD subunit
MFVNLLLIPVLLPLAVGLFTFILPKKDRWIRAILALLTPVVIFAAALWIYIEKIPEFRFPLLEIGRFNLNFDLVPTPLSSFILIFATGFGFLIALYSLVYMAGKDRLKEYYAFFLFAVGGASGVLLADHFIVFAFFLVMVAAITKAGAMPFHSWIPSASEAAPAPVMALLPAAVDKLLGIYRLVRIVNDIFSPTQAIGLVLMIIGAVTVIAAVMVAMVQHDLMRLLSYHAISQVGYMVLGIGTLTPIGIAGGLFHMLNHSIYKSCLFLCGGAVEKRAKSTELSELGGLARAMPITFISCLVAALAISGVPPFNGFVSKWLVYQGVIETGTRASFIFLIAAMFGSALTLASFIKVIYSVFLGTKSEKTERIKKEVGFGMVLPLIVLSLLCLLFGVFYRYPLNYFIFPGAAVQAAAPGIWNAAWATGFIILGLLIGLIIYLLGKYRKSARVVAPFTGGEKLEQKTGRVIGTHFYDTIKEMPVLKGTYAAQGKGHLDPYTWIGGLGLAILEPAGNPDPFRAL